MNKVLVVSLCVSGLAACGQHQIKENMAEHKAAPAVQMEAVKAEAATSSAELYEIEHDGRLYVFYDFDLYQEFREMGETPFRLTRIGAGPEGQTVVFGLLGADKKKTAGIPGVDLLDGKLPAPDDFYGELVKDGRIYVVDDYAQFMTVHNTGEAAYRLTQIGSGPQGETVVYVLTSENKKQHPEALIAKFNGLHRL